MKKKNLPMSVAEASAIVLGSRSGRLGEPSKMPGYSFGISANECIRGRVLARDPRTPCFHCYAKIAYYGYYYEVKIAHERRLRCLTNQNWTLAMITLLRHNCLKSENPAFRWFDSGDLQGVWMVENIVRTALGTPEIRHFLPTHEPYMLREYLKLVAKNQAPAFPSNLCVRVSADYIGCPPESITGIEHLPTSTIHRVHGHRNRILIPGKRVSVECTAYKRGMMTGGSGQCGNCRACWTPQAQNISFALHNERRYDLTLPLPFATPVIEDQLTPIVTSWKGGRTYSKRERREMAARQCHLSIFDPKK